MKMSDLTTLVVVVGALVLTGLEKLDVDAMLALVGGVLLRSPLSTREDVVD